MAKERLAARWLAALVLLGSWQVAASWVSSSMLPSPLSVLRELATLAGDRSFYAAIGATLASTLLGLLITVALAVPLGMAVGKSRFMYASTRLPVDFLRTIPPVTLLPLAILFWGPTLSMKVFLIVVGAFWPLFIQATYAVREVDPIVVDMARAFRIGRGSTWTLIMWPSAAPFLVTGFRVASTMALLLSIAGELIGNAPGIGQQIGLAQLNALPEVGFAYVVVAAILGVLLNLASAGAQRRLLFWHPSVRSVVSPVAFAM